jgi:hypothetical protein
MVGAGNSEDVLTQPADEHGYVVGQGDRPILFLTEYRQPFGLGIAATVPLGPCHASLLLVSGFDDAIGPIVQEPDQLTQIA